MNQVFGDFTQLATQNGYLALFLCYYLVLVHAFLLPKLWALFIFSKSIAFTFYIQRFTLKITQNIL